MTETLDVIDDVVDAEIIGEDKIVEDNPTPEQKRIRQATEYIEGLYETADFLRDHPDVIPHWGGVDIVFFCSDADALARMIRKLGPCEKIESDYVAGGKVKIGPHHVKVTTSKENTCKKVPTGEVKPKAVVADPEDVVPEGAKNVRTVTTTTVVYDVDEPVLDWECPSLLNPGGAS